MAETREDAFEILSVFGALAATSVGVAQIDSKFEKMWRSLSLVFVFLAFTFIYVAVSMPKEKHMTLKEYKRIVRTQKRIVYEVI